MRLIRTALCVVFALCPAVLSAQSFTGTITGTVKDVSGASIPHATVTITNLQTSRQDAITTDLEGRYTSLPLQPGEYRVEAGLQVRISRRRASISGESGNILLKSRPTTRPTPRPQPAEWIVHR